VVQRSFAETIEAIFTHADGRKGEGVGMDFLKNAALPQSLEHFHLIILIAAINSLLFVPFFAFLLGSSVLSYRFDGKGRKENNPLYNQIAKAIIDVALYNKSVLTFLGIIPGLSLVFIYTQMLQSTSSISAGLAGFGFLSLVIALVLLYTYKYTFRVQGLLDVVKDNKTNGDVDDYRRTNISVHVRTGKWGVFFLFVAMFLYASAMSITTNPSSWADIGSIFDVLISADVWLKFLIFLVFSLGITGVGILYFFFGYQGGKQDIDEQLKAIVHKIARQFIVISMLVLPVLVLLNIFTLSPDVLSGAIYLLAGLTLLFLFLAAHFLYGYFKLQDLKAIGYGLFMFLCAAASLIINDHVMIGNATKEHAAVLSLSYDKATEELKSKLGVTLVALTGEDIYSGKCSACHLFDQKKVGPPYNETVPKYNGDKAKIIAFVMNPVKKDPAYPPMPNQGLKPAEADSVVTYILSKIAGNTQQK
jgi:cytochrome c